MVKSPPNDIISNGVYGVGVASYITPQPQSKIGFAAYTRVIYPTTSTTIPYMHESALLYKDSGTSPISSADDVAYNSYYSVAVNIVTISSGHQYHVAGIHYVIWPLGCYPVDGHYVTVAGYIA